MVPLETIKFCFPESPDVSLDFVSGNITTLGKTKLTVSLGTIHKVDIVRLNNAIQQAPIVERMYVNTKSHYPVDSVECFVNTNPVDSSLQ